VRILPQHYAGTIWQFYNAECAFCQTRWTRGPGAPVGRGPEQRCACAFRDVRLPCGGASRLKARPVPAGE
jgi:hypothetical protein